MANNDLILLNRDKEVFTGTFKRITLYSSTILDYVLITKNIQNDIIRMGIDDEVSLLSGSDHVAVRVDIWVEQMENQRKNVQSKVVVSANLEAYGNAPKPKVKRQNKQLKRLQYQKKSAKQKSKKLLVERASIILNHGIWAEEDQNSLEYAIKEGGDLGNEINRKKMELAMSKGNKKRIKETLKTEKFWKVAQ